MALISALTRRSASWPRSRFRTALRARAMFGGCGKEFGQARIGFQLPPKLSPNLISSPMAVRMLTGEYRPSIHGLVLPRALSLGFDISDYAGQRSRIGQATGQICAGYVQVFVGAPCGGVNSCRFALSASRQDLCPPELAAFPEYATYATKIVNASFPAAWSRWMGRSAGSSRPPRHHDPGGVVETSEEPSKAYNPWWPSGRTAPPRVLPENPPVQRAGLRGSTFIKPGPSTGPVVFESGGAVFGLMTCYDLGFPELAGSLADAGAQVLLVCSY
jgi:hypothetical protein